MLGTVVSIVAFWIVLESVDVEHSLTVLGGAQAPWVAAVAACVVIDVIVRSLRWQRLLAPLKRIAFGPVLSYVLVGFLANNVLPARLGELVRSHYLGDREGMSRTTALGTVVVERIVDTAFAVVIAALAILALNVRGVVTSTIAVGGALVALLVVALAIAIAAHRLPGLPPLAARIERWPRIGQLAARLRGGLAVAARPRTLVETIVLTAAAWAATTVAFATAGQAVGLELGIGEAALISSGVALATAIPAGPGYLGTYEIAAVKLAEALGRPAEPAFALAIIVHAMALVVTSLGGLAALASLRRRPETVAP